MTSRLLLAWFLVSAAIAGCGGTPEASDAGGDAALDAAPECHVDGDCDDGRACNGSERCSVGACVSGTPMHCDDGVACTIDACSEAVGRCVFRVPDEDMDGSGAATCTDGSGHPLGDDCDDHDASRFPHNTELCDAAHVDEDCDATTLGARDDDGDGFVSNLCCDGATCGDDCDDTRAAVHVGATEVCNRLDDDCDGHVDEGVSVAGFVDADRDGYGDATMPTTACGSAVGFSANGTDCDDTRASVHPGQPEICDGIDNDCDPATGIDQNAQAVTWYRDADGDGFGTPSDTTTSCAPPAGYSLLGTDCDDTAAARNPGTAELCNAIDDDCNGVADFVIAAGDTEDDDRDGIPDAACHDPRASDCDDRDPTSGPGQTETCDGRDNDCDGRIDEDATSVAFYRDADGDGFGTTTDVSVACIAPGGYARRGGDCDDASNTRFPGALEPCDGIDNDCDTAVDEGTYASASCIYPHASGICAGGACRMSSCATGFGDCTSAPGCESDVSRDPLHCGSCAIACTSAPACIHGACAHECSPGATCTPNFCEWGSTCSAAATCGTTTLCGPQRLEVSPTTTTASRGVDLGTAFRETCPRGEIPIGLEAREADAADAFELGGVALVCGAIQVFGDVVTTTPSTRLPATSGDACCAATTAPVGQSCPSGSVLVGFEGSADTHAIRTIVIHCAQLVASGSSIALDYAVTTGSVMLMSPIGDMPQTPFAATECPTGTIAAGMTGSGTTTLSQLALTCGVPTPVLATTTPVAGAPNGGSGAILDCPAGQVPIALTVGPAIRGSFYDGYLARFSFQCGALHVSPNGAAWNVSILAGGTTLPATGPLGTNGGFTDPPTTLTCPANEVIVGVAGITGHEIALRCAPMTVTGGVATGFQVGYGTVDQTAMAGNNPSGGPYGPLDCPAGTVASGFYTRAGEILDGISLRCAPPVITP